MTFSLYTLTLLTFYFLKKNPDYFCNLGLCLHIFTLDAWNPDRLNLCWHKSEREKLLLLWHVVACSCVFVCTEAARVSSELQFYSGSISLRGKTLLCHCLMLTRVPLTWTSCRVYTVSRSTLTALCLYTWDDSSARRSSVRLDNYSIGCSTCLDPSLHNAYSINAFGLIGLEYLLRWCLTPFVFPPGGQHGHVQPFSDEDASIETLSHCSSFSDAISVADEGNLPCLYLSYATECVTCAPASVWTRGYACWLQV